ncbi:unnamed protein product, partial [marine sediment metagenome]
KKMFHALYLMPETLPFLLKIFPLQEGYFYKDDHLRVNTKEAAAIYLGSIV